MEIQHQTFGSRGAFFVEQDGQVVAEMTYRRAGDDRMAIDHTAVAEELGGQGAPSVSPTPRASRPTMWRPSICSMNWPTTRRCT